MIRVRDLDEQYQRQLGVTVFAEFPQGTETVRMARCGQCGMEFHDPGAPGSAAFYAALGRSPHYYSTTRWEFTETLKRLPEDPDLVDIGCGDGFFLSQVKGTRKRGLELNPDAVKRARDRGLNVQEGLLTVLPDGSADVLTLFQVLEHVERPVEVLAEAARVLRPGGRLFVAVPNNDSYIGDSLHDPLNAPPHHPLRWRPAALRYVPQVAPFDLEELLLEPLASEHRHQYRRALFIKALGRWRGRRIPVHRTGAGMIFLRRVSSVWMRLSLMLAPGLPTEPGSGFSVMAVYRKRG